MRRPASFNRAGGERRCRAQGSATRRFVEGPETVQFYSRRTVACCFADLKESCVCAGYYSNQSFLARFDRLTVHLGFEL